MTTTASGTTAPATTLTARRSRHVVRYFEKTRKAVPTNISPGCQHKQAIIPQKPDQNGRSLAINSSEARPKIISGNLGCVPPINISATAGDTYGSSAAITPAT